MARSQETFTKKDREKQRVKKQLEKKEKMNERKLNKEKGKSLEDMMAYVDDNGNLPNRPTDPRKKKVYRKDDMLISVPKQEDIPDVQRTGVVTYFNEQKGFGFINDSETGMRIFFHVNETSTLLNENDKVIFRLEKGPKGPVAMSVNTA
jgi:cold shock CspA family protein